MEPNFCIITTTHKRPDAILQCVESVYQQTYGNHQHIIVVDDTVSNYSQLRLLTQNRSDIHILTNEANLGKNASVNKALGYLHANNFTGHVIFLDDDDWLSPSCLQDFADILIKSQHPWIVSQRADATSHEPFTKNTTGRTKIYYQYDCLLKKNFTGDATHCIEFNSTRNILFPTSVKNAEEWLYFSHLSTFHKYFIYLPKIGTFSNGYSSEGLTNMYHKKSEDIKNNLPLLKEMIDRRICSPLIYLFICARLVRSFI